jgi:HD domain
MSTKTTNRGKAPGWLESNVSIATAVCSKREEIEAKFILHKKDAQAALQYPDVKKYIIEQFYLPVSVVESVLPKDVAPDDLRTYSEWRIRKKNDAHLFTCKRTKEGITGVRDEYETSLDEQIYVQLKKEALRDGAAYFVKKIRYTRSQEIAQEEVTIEIDVYSETGSGKLDMDFVTCEVEVASVEILELIRNHGAINSDFAFLGLGLDATGVEELSNKYLAQYGFNKNSFSEYKTWLKKKSVTDLAAWADKQGDMPGAIWKKSLLQKVERLASLSVTPATYKQKLQQTAYIQAQGVLQSLAFTESDSLGRSEETGQHQQQMDRLGYGWLRDFHTIVSSDPYLRLSWKPQIFRPGLGHNNTTTRGAHTLDVIACSAQLSKQLGLNTELCMAIAAIHDIGHPAGGHVGEEILLKLSGRHFKHHVFSLSLADLFSMNVLKEVQVGAFFHKSHGGKLETPPGKPQEFGVVRIADKIAYVSWDFYDSVRNNFIRKEGIPDEIYEVLGKEPLDWINTLIKAVVLESANFYKVSFSTRSGDIFDAYATAKSLIYNKVHTAIEWNRLKTDYSLAYQCIQASFPGLDPVPIIAYMTDAELVQVAKIFEAQPKGITVPEQFYNAQGFGFLDIVNILRKMATDDLQIYYTSIRGKL